MHEKEVHAFFISNTFISKTRLLAKNQAKAKQNPETELLQFENYSLSSSTLASKNNRRFYEIYWKTTFKWGYLINDNKNEAENKKDHIDTR